MGGRNAKPVSLHIAQGNPNRLTKAEIERRKEAEVKIGDTICDYKLECPTYVKNDTIAYEKWKELLKEYRKAEKNGIELISSTDIGMLARYCKTYSEYQDLVNHRNRINNIDLDDYDEAAEELDEKYDKRTRNDMFKKINYLLSVGGILGLDTAINKKMDMLIKMEDRLFLNPLSKVKNVPKKEKEKENPLAERGFGNV